MPEPPPFMAPRRAGPLTLLAIAVLALILAWAVLDTGLHILGVAASPLGWLLQLIGRIAAALAAHGG